MNSESPRSVWTLWTVSLCLPVPIAARTSGSFQQYPAAMSRYQRRANSPAARSRGVQRMQHLQAWYGDETAVVRPEFRCPSLEGSESDLEIENTGSAHLQLVGELHTACCQCRWRRKHYRSPGFHQGFDETSGKLWTRSTAQTCGMRDHAPGLEDAWRGYAPSTCIVRRALQRALCRVVLGTSRPVRVYEEICVDGNHRCDLIQSCRAERSATSTPGGRPPGATIH